MLLPVIKEIETEHKVYKDYNMRQMIGIVTTILFFIIFYIIFRDLAVAVGFAVPIALLSVFLSKSSDTGITPEESILKKAQIHYYHNESRKYRTRNRYMSMYNTAYKKMRNKDNNNKNVVKQIKKTEKVKVKRMKQSKIKAIM